MLKIHRALTTIHMIGQSPNAAPSAPASNVCPTGMEYTARAMMMATPSVITDASHAFIRNAPSRMNSVSSGSAAKIEVTPSEWETGSRTCLYMLVPPSGGPSYPRARGLIPVVQRPPASTCALCRARRPVPLAIWVRHENPSATTSVSSGAPRTAGRSTRSPALTETSYWSPAT